MGIEVEIKFGRKFIFLVDIFECYFIGNRELLKVFEERRNIL